MLLRPEPPILQLRPGKWLLPFQSFQQTCVKKKLSYDDLEETVSAYFYVKYIVPCFQQISSLKSKYNKYFTAESH